MKVSRAGIVLIKSFEGFRPAAARREDGRWVIGYGHTASAREGATVSEQDAELLLQYDLLPVVAAVSDNAPHALNQHQFDALASFAFSIGVERFLKSDVLARLRAGEVERAADALIGWPQPQPADAHLRRRRAERALFNADPAAPVALADLLSAPQVDVQPEPAPASPPPTSPRPTPPAPDAALAFQMMRYSPYAAAVTGALPPVTRPTPIRQESAGALTTAHVALPPQPAAEPARPAPPEAAPELPAFQAAPQPAWRQPVVTTPVVDQTAFPSTSPVMEDGPTQPQDFAQAAPGPSEMPPPPLVLTAPPAVEAQVVERPVWPNERRSVERPDQDGLFLHETITASDFAPVLRHEPEAPSQGGRFDWSETGAFLIMGGVGLASFGAAMAAFRLAGDQAVGGRETSLIGWVLAVIAAVCVGVSGYNLYTRLGRGPRI